MHINLIELWTQMGWPVRCVVLMLTAQGVASLAVVVDRLLYLRATSKANRTFAQNARTPLEALVLSDCIAVAEKSDKDSPLARLLLRALRTFTSLQKKGVSNSVAAEAAQRASSRELDEVREEMFRGVNVLASTGSTAPFVGLLGTVLGIIQAFHQIAADGSGGIGAIGSSIGEALIVTGYGLLVAIPTVLIFNWLSARLAAQETRLLNSTSEVVDSLEGSDSNLNVAKEEEPTSRANQNVESVSHKRTHGHTSTAEA